MHARFEEYSYILFFRTIAKISYYFGIFSILWVLTVYEKIRKYINISYVHIPLNNKSKCIKE